MLETYEKNSRKKLIATFLAILVIASSVLIADHAKSEKSSGTLAVTQTTASTTPATTATDTTTATTTPSTTATTSNTSGYKDGTYTASSDYSVPHGDETIQVSLTISNGVITNSSVQNSESDPDSASYQESFTSTYKSAVVGKSISGLQIRTIAGASDTSQGFNDALSQIASKAQA